MPGLAGLSGVGRWEWSKRARLGPVSTPMFLQHVTLTLPHFISNADPADCTEVSQSSKTSCQPFEALRN